MISDDWRRQMLSEEEQEEITKDLYRYFENNVEDFRYIIGWWFFDEEDTIIQVLYRKRSTKEAINKFVKLDWLRKEEPMEPNNCTFIPNNMELRTLLETKGCEIIRDFSELVGYVRFPEEGLVKVFYKDKYGCSDTAVVHFSVIAEKGVTNVCND